MKLTDLSPEWIKHTEPDHQRHVESMAEANGIWFLCPLCMDRRNRGEKVHVHGVLCWTHQVQAGIDPGPGRWEMKGTGFDDVTLSPSVHLTGPGCGWHGWITNGEALLG